MFRLLLITPTEAMGSFIKQLFFSLLEKTKGRNKLSSLNKEEKKKKKKMEKKKKMKLHLVLDLDQTLLHYVPVSELSDKEKYIMQELDSRGDLLSSFNGGTPRHLIKLRPFLREFLKEANKLFRMHVYTMGTYGYARYILSEIDPGKRYFGNRVITREKSPHNKTLDRISADQRRVVIVDDNASAWPQHKPNLVQVKQYIYFRYQMTNNDSEEEFYSHAEKKSDESRSNGSLSKVLKILQKAHTRFQEEEDSYDLRLLIRD